MALYQINILLLLFDASHDKSYLVTPFPVDAPHDASAHFHYRRQCGPSDWGLLRLLAGPRLLQHRMHRLHILHRHTARVGPWNMHCVCVITRLENMNYVKNLYLCEKGSPPKINDSNFQGTHMSKKINSTCFVCFNPLR